MHACNSQQTETLPKQCKYKLYVNAWEETRQYRKLSSQLCLRLKINKLQYLQGLIPKAAMGQLKGKQPAAAE